MAAIDTLLRLIPSQKAEALKLAPATAPVLIVAEEDRPLSMPPLEAGMIQGFIDEIAGDAAAPPDGEQRFVYHVDGAWDIDVVVTRGAGMLLGALFRPAGTGTPTAAAPDVAPAAVLASAPPRSPSPSPSASSSPGHDTRAILGLLNETLRREASDLFLSAGIPATWRVHGVISAAGGLVPTDEDLEAVFGVGLSETQRQRFDATGGVDFAYVLPAVAGGPPHRFRVSLFHQELGLAAALRPVRGHIPSLPELRLPPAVAQLTEHRHGLVLMTGPTGSGKSTTLAALVEQLNRSTARHVITIEDPIEFRYSAGRCLVHQREVGSHVSSFADGVRSALRSSPDVILVGEMRDPETISAALTAAETGHLVLSTLHCGAAGLAVDRIIHGFPQGRQQQVRAQLADVLCSVVSQRLLPSVAGGRVPAVEVLHVTHAVAALIREGRSHQIPSQIQTGRDAGMIPLDRSLAELVRAGLVARDTALTAAEDPTFLEQLLA